MIKLKRAIKLFAVGGCSYCALELIYRRKTHISMLFAGGISLLIIELIRLSCKKLAKAIKGAACGAAITLIELLLGLFVNKKLKKKVWDYSAVPLNYKGQICLPFSVLWSLISFPAMKLCKKLK